MAWQPARRYESGMATGPRVGALRGRVPLPQSGPGAVLQAANDPTDGPSITARSKPSNQKDAVSSRKPQWGVRGMALGTTGFPIQYIILCEIICVLMCLS